jgi:hypothetical protein
VRSAAARTITAGTLVANPGATVTVPVTVDDLSGVGASVVTVGYDPTVVVCLGVEAGAASDGKDMFYVDTGSGQICVILSGSSQSVKGGEIFRMRFSVRSGTAGLFSDVTLLDAQFAATDGVSDLSASNPVTVVNGMVRSLATDAAAARLEAAFRVAPQTSLATLTLADGDGLVADADGEPIRVSGAVTAAGAIPVDAPLGGWQTGAYALLSTPTKDLTFALADASNATIRVETANGLMTYYADVTVDGEVEIVAESGTLSAATRAQVKALLASELAANPGVTSVTVKGDAALVAITADLGIAPLFDVLGTTATATYATPTLKIIAFEPQTGRVRIKVTPGEGNAIRASLATGCVHVYGTKDLSQKMRYISGTAFDLTPYLKDATRGEADLTVALGSHTFIKVKVETTIKQEGEEE